MAKLTQSIGHAGLNSGAAVYARMMRTDDIKKDPVLEKIFVINNNLMRSIALSMKESGYDKAEPVVIWKGKDIVVDGHTRLKAAIEAGLDEIPVEEKEFASIEEAKRYTYKRQAERRNLTQAEIFAAATELEIKATRDGSGRASEILGKELGISAATIQHARKIASHGSPETVEKVRGNRLSINKAYQQIKREKQKASNGKNAQDRDYAAVSGRIQKDNLGIAKRQSMERACFIEALLLLKNSLENGNNQTGLFTDTVNLLVPITGENILENDRRDEISGELENPEIFGDFDEE
jgi:ParB family chromosome partitioning protein